MRQRRSGGVAMKRCCMGKGIRKGERVRDTTRSRGKGGDEEDEDQRIAHVLRSSLCTSKIRDRGYNVEKGLVVWSVRDLSCNLAAGRSHLLSHLSDLPSSGDANGSFACAGAALFLFLNPWGPNLCQLSSRFSYHCKQDGETTL